MKQSSILWMKSIGFNLLYFAGVFLVCYAVTGSFWKAALLLVLIVLVAQLGRLGSAYSSMAQQHQAREIMEKKS